MLYDNAQLVELYTMAWRATGSPLHAARVGETVDWLLREMTDPGGAFHATLDADSKGRRAASTSGTRPASARRWAPISMSSRRSEEHTSELQSLMRISYAVFCLKKKKQTHERREEKA